MNTQRIYLLMVMILGILGFSSTTGFSKHIESVAPEIESLSSASYPILFGVKMEAILSLLPLVVSQKTVDDIEKSAIALGFNLHDDIQSIQLIAGLTENRFVLQLNGTFQLDRIKQLFVQGSTSSKNALSDYKNIPIISFTLDHLAALIQKQNPKASKNVLQGTDSSPLSMALIHTNKILIGYSEEIQRLLDHPVGSDAEIISTLFNSSLPDQKEWLNHSQDYIAWMSLTVNDSIKNILKVISTNEPFLQPYVDGLTYLMIFGKEVGSKKALRYDVDIVIGYNQQQYAKNVSAQIDSMLLIANIAFLTGQKVLPSDWAFITPVVQSIRVSTQKSQAKVSFSVTKEIFAKLVKKVEKQFFALDIH